MRKPVVCVCCLVLFWCVQQSHVLAVSLCGIDKVGQMPARTHKITRRGPNVTRAFCLSFSRFFLSRLVSLVSVSSSFRSAHSFHFSLLSLSLFLSLSLSLSSILSPQNTLVPGVL